MAMDMPELSEVLRFGRERFPRATAIHQGGHHLSYGQIFEDVERIAGLLIQAGVGAGEIVAVDIPRPVTHWLVQLALMRIGAVSLSLTDRREAEIATLPQIATVIGGPETTLPLRARLRLIRVDAKWLRQPAPRSLLPPCAEAAATLGRICFTSGTSGGPKAVALTAELLGARLKNTARRSRIDTRTVLWCGLGADTAYGFTATLAAWREGAAVAFSRGGESDYAYFLARQVNVLIASPAAVSTLLRAAVATQAPSLQAIVIVAGGRLTIGLRDALRARLCAEVLVAYGSSEAGGVTLGSAEGLDADPGNVGDVFPDVEAEVVDEEGRAAPPGTTGHLRVRSRSCVPGYLNAPEASAAHFVDGWFQSGDLARLSADGSLMLAGRPVDILNFGGVKFAADEIDAAARAQDGVDDACAVLLPEGGRDGGALAIVIVGRPTSEAALAARLRAALPALPRFRLIVAPSLPRGSMGKINRAALGSEIGAAALKVAAGGPEVTGVRFLGLY